MNNLILGTLILIAAILWYIAYQIRQVRNDLEEIKVLSTNHYRYGSVSLQYILVVVRTVMLSLMQQCAEKEDYQAAAEWKSTAEKVEKLIKTKINL